MERQQIKIVLVIAMLPAFMPLAHATYMPFNTNVKMNVGIGTTITNAGAALSVMSGNVGIGTWVPAQTLSVIGNVSATDGFLGPIAYGGGTNSYFSASNFGIGTNVTQARLVVVGGNVGIGTWTAAGGNLIINGGGNVGIGSAWPGQALDVVGTVRATNFIGNGSGLTGLPSSLWATQNTTDESLAGGNVGIGTTFTTTSALSVMNGNVGIGTWVPASALQVNGDINAGNIYLAADIYLGAYANLYGTYGIIYDGDQNVFTDVNGYTSSASGSPGLYFDLINGLTLSETGRADFNIDSNGNVGVGTWVPHNSLEVKGGNVGIGTSLGGAKITVGGNAHTVAGSTGRLVCVGLTSGGAACLGYCTAAPSTDTCTCSCM